MRDVVEEFAAPVAERDFGAEAARRAPFAAAAALAVLGLGAGLLGFAMTKRGLSPEVAPAVVAEIEASESESSNRPEPLLPRKAGEVSAKPTEGALSASPALADGASPLSQSPSAPDSSPRARSAQIADAPSARGGGADEPLMAALDRPFRVNPMRAAQASEFAPRLKPGGAETATPAAATASAESVLSFASVWVADERDRPPSFFYESDLLPQKAPAAVGGFRGDVAAPPSETTVVLAKGETFVDALERAGVRIEDRNEAAYAFGEFHNLRRLLPGQELALTVAAPNQTLFQQISAKEPPPSYLLSLDFRPDAENRILLSRAHDGSFSAKEYATPLTTRLARIEGRIDGSLYLSAKRQGAPDEVIAGLARMFAYDVDFQREIMGGDEFEAIFELRFDEQGRMVSGGDILFGRLNWRGRQKEKGYYRFEQHDDGRGDYFDAAGESARRLLMKTPIDGARLSSGFGTRRHPILGYQKAHKGVDFAAHRGTPIMAAGDGVVERAGPYGSFGNYVRIRHVQGYKTAYAHMNSIRKGIRSGARVRQGDTIGTVGSTGRSTGPHLHYEVHLNNVAVNPQRLKIATGYELGSGDLERFKIVRDRIDALRAPREPEEPALVAGGAKAKAL